MSLYCTYQIKWIRGNAVLGLVACAILLLASPGFVEKVAAQCHRGDILIGEDERYWYCSTPDPPGAAALAIEQINQHLIGKEWRYRRAVLDAVGSLVRPNVTPYVYGGKLRIQSGGRVTWVCVSEKCTGAQDVGVDCSGLVEFGAAHAACFVRGVYSTAGLAVRGVIGKASEQAAYFRDRNAFIPPAGNPNPGDFIFFKQTIPGETGITHVGIYVGRPNDGSILIVHASSKAQRVIFARLKPESNLTKKIAGYGDVSVLSP